jgi:hypothetical protein
METELNTNGLIAHYRTYPDPVKDEFALFWRIDNYRNLDGHWFDDNGNKRRRADLRRHFHQQDYIAAGKAIYEANRDDPLFAKYVKGAKPYDLT